jgi:hypothetical protein
MKIGNRKVDSVTAGKNVAEQCGVGEREGLGGGGR